MGGGKDGSVGATVGGATATWIVRAGGGAGLNDGGPGGKPAGGGGLLMEVRTNLVDKTARLAHKVRFLSGSCVAHIS